MSGAVADFHDGDRALKVAYDAAAEALCQHIEGCPNCSMSAIGCDDGRMLALAEDVAWRSYRRMRA